MFVKLLREEESPEEVLLRKLLPEARLLMPGVRILAEGKEEEEEAAASSSRGTDGLRRADWGSGCCMFCRRVMLLSSTLRQGWQ